MKKWAGLLAGVPFLFAFDGSGRFVDFATNPIVVMILLSAMLTGFILELFTPGFGIPGAVGTLALIIFTAGHFMSGDAGILTVLLIVTGVVFILAEVILPGGIVGFIGFLLFAAGVLFAGASLLWTAISLLIAFMIATAALILMVKVLGKEMKFFKKFILSDSTDTERGYVSNVTRTDLIGKVGRAKTALRPSGTVVIDGERVDAVAEGVFIAGGKEVAVVKTEGVRVVVREIES
ncbi:nodulation efficiency protein NfeD [Domibacillus sp. A3M-37]|uniref:NfeD family protein n=1 Tax=Domibacillus sp. A3M-37 TaxID=2962037 RepID=UPI0020B8561B|nr:NfeD family protein [Domibacillus sp. A3M-37]MCP3764277.1 nodulation efficiency protein NfeD [Domibacillus sp. A3M-37]